MVATDRVREIFADAHEMYEASLERWDAGDVRDAAEKAWCATYRATGALILARTGEEPDISPATSAGIQILSGVDRRARSLARRYFTSQGWLHGQCFYQGHCEPVAETERRIRQTIEYIRDAEALAYEDSVAR